MDDPGFSRLLEILIKHLAEIEHASDEQIDLDYACNLFESLASDLQNSGADFCNRIIISIGNIGFSGENIKLKQFAEHFVDDFGLRE